MKQGNKKGNKSDKNVWPPMKASLVEEWETFKKHFCEEYPDGVLILMTKRVALVGDQKLVNVREDIVPDGHDDEAGAIYTTAMFTSKRMREVILTAAWTYISAKMGDAMSTVFSAILIALKDREEKTGEGREETQGDADSQ